MTIFDTETVFCRLLIRTAKMKWTWIEMRQIIQKIIVTVKTFFKVKKESNQSHSYFELVVLSFSEKEWYM